MKWIVPISLLIFFELVADIFAKEWSVQSGYILATGALVSYVIANSFWLFALKNGSGLARGAVIFSVASAIVAIILGVFLFKENVTKVQMTGMILGLVAITLIFWND